MTVLAEPLPNEPAALKAMLLAERAAHVAETERLRQIIKELQRHRFGRRAESLPADQLQLALEEVEQSAAEDEAGAEAKDLERGKSRAASRRRNRGSLPAHLPRIEQVVDIAEKSCPCCFRHLGRKLFGMAPGLHLAHVVTLFPNGRLAVEG
jgi:transposase